MKLFFMRLPVEVPARADFGHAVMAIGVVGVGPLCVLEGAAADGVDSNEHDHHHDVEHRELVPAPPHVLQHPCFARLALVAQHCRRVVPPVAVRILRHQRHRVVARRWRLATPRLYHHQILN